MFIPTGWSRLAYRADDLIRRRGVFQLYRRFQGSEWWSREAILDAQITSLRLLLKGAQAHSPYYAGAFKRAGVVPEDVNSLGDLTALPTLTRDLIRTRGADIRSRATPERDLIPNNTSGSTGSITHFWVDRECWRWRDAASLQVWERMGVPAFAPTINIWGAAIDQRWIAGYRNRARQFLDNKRVLSAFELGPDAMAQCADLLARMRPRVLTGYASVIDSMATYVRKVGFRWDPPDGFTVVTQAEMLYPEQRENIADAFGARVLNLYGSRELGVIATECPSGGGMHVFGERHILELLPTPDGLGERIVITDLQNTGFPFIRYEIGDLAQPGETRCSCTRCHQRFTGVLGRSFAVIRSGEGRAVAGNFFSFLLRAWVPASESWQVLQTRRDAVEIRVAPRGIVSESARARITEEVRRALGESMQVAIEERDRLDPLPSGKRNFVAIAPEVEAGNPAR